MDAKLSFGRLNPDFSLTLKKRVHEYFDRQEVRKRGNRKLYIKTAVLMACAAGTYYLLVFAALPGWLSLILCALFGLNLAAIGFNIMHDGAHGSYSQKAWVNSLMSYSLNLMGGCAYLWKQKHNTNHHSFTNIEGFDDDIDVQPWIKTNRNQKGRWYHRYQHIYWVVLYGMSYLLWVYSKDFKKYFSGKIADTDMKKMDLKEHFIFWISKAVYLSVFIVIPALQLGWPKVLAGYLLASFVCGWVLAVIFQLAHVVEDTAFPLAEEGAGRRIEQDWAIHQLATTANFGTGNKLLSWFAGGLNYQIEHHLFPKISHVHYPGISKVVKDVCRQFSIPYIEYPTMMSALRSHIAHLKLVGAGP